MAIFNSYVKLPEGNAKINDEYGLKFRPKLLVGGLNHLEKYEFVSWEGLPHFLMENKQCLKPPTKLSIDYQMIMALITDDNE